MNIKHLNFILNITIIAILSAIFSSIFNISVHFLTKFNMYFLDQNIRFIFPIFIVVFIIYATSEKLIFKENVKYGTEAIIDEINNIECHRMNLKKLIFKLMLAGVSISSGFLVGPFGPVCHLGGAIGSEIAYKRKYDDDTIRIFIATGVAAALSAVQRNPIFACFFVMEIVLRGRYFNYILPILYAALISSALDTLIVGKNSLYAPLSELDKLGISKLEAINIETILQCIIIAVLIALVAMFFKKLINFIKKFNKKINFSLYFNIVVFILTAFLACVYKDFLYLDSFRILDSSYLGMQISEFAPILFTIIILSALQQGAGVHGGSFKPIIYIGLFSGILLFLIFDILALNSLDYSQVLLVALACMIASFLRAPISSILLVSKILAEYNLSQMVIFAVIISYSLTLLMDKYFFGK